MYNTTPWPPFIWQMIIEYNQIYKHKNRTKTHTWSFSSWKKIQNENKTVVLTLNTTVLPWLINKRNKQKSNFIQNEGYEFIFILLNTRLWTKNVFFVDILASENKGGHRFMFPLPLENSLCRIFQKINYKQIYALQN